MQIDQWKLIETVGTKAWELAIRAVIVESYIAVSVGFVFLLIAAAGVTICLKTEEDDGWRIASYVMMAIGFMAGVILIGQGVYGLYVPELAAINKILGRR